MDLGLKYCKTGYTRCLILSYRFKKNFIENFFKFSKKIHVPEIKWSKPEVTKTKKNRIWLLDGEDDKSCFQQEKIKKNGFFPQNFSYILRNRFISKLIKKKSKSLLCKSQI